MYALPETRCCTREQEKKYKIKFAGPDHFYWLFSKLVGEADSRVQGVKDSSECIFNILIKILIISLVSIIKVVHIIANVYFLSID